MIDIDARREQAFGARVRVDTKISGGDDDGFFDNDVFASERVAEQVLLEAGYEPDDPLYDRMFQIAQTAGERAIRALLVDNDVNEIIIHDDEDIQHKFVEKVYIGYQDH